MFFPLLPSPSDSLSPPQILSLSPPQILSLPPQIFSLSLRFSLSLTLFHKTRPNTVSSSQFSTPLFHLQFTSTNFLVIIFFGLLLPFMIPSPLFHHSRRSSFYCHHFRSTKATLFSLSLCSFSPAVFLRLGIEASRTGC